MTLSKFTIVSVIIVPLMASQIINFQGQESIENVGFTGFPGNQVPRGRLFDRREAGSAINSEHIVRRDFQSTEGAPAADIFWGWEPLWGWGTTFVAPQPSVQSNSVIIN